MAKFSWLKYLLYPVAFIFLTIFFVYITFPTHLLNDYIVDRIEQVLQGPDKTPLVKISSISPWRFSGLKFKGLDIQVTNNGISQKWHIDSVAARAWFLGQAGYTFNIDEKNGDASGFIKFSKKGNWEAVNINLDEFDFSTMPLELLMGLPFSGPLTADINFDAGQEIAKNAQGSIIIKANKLSIGPGALRGLFGMGGSLTVPNINLGKVEIDIEMSKGHALSKKFRFSGGDLELEMKFDVQLNERIMSSQIVGSGWFKLSEKLIASSPEVASIIEVFIGTQTPGTKNNFKLNGSLSFPGFVLDRG